MKHFLLPFKGISLEEQPSLNASSRKPIISFSLSLIEHFLSLDFGRSMKMIYWFRNWVEQTTKGQIRNIWNELAEGERLREREKWGFQMKQSTDDLAKFKPSQTLTLNIALGSGSIAGAGERERQPALHQTHIVDGGNEFSQASCDFKGAALPENSGKGFPLQWRLQSSAKVSPKGMNLQEEKITFKVQERILSFHEVAWEKRKTHGEQEGWQEKIQMLIWGLESYVRIAKWSGLCTNNVAFRFRHLVVWIMFSNLWEEKPMDPSPKWLPKIVSFPLYTSRKPHISFQLFIQPKFIERQTVG